jgi:hypothetical protein
MRRIEVQSQPSQIVGETLSWKYPTQNRVGRMVHMVEHCLPSKCEALSSSPNTSKKKKKNTPRGQSRKLKSLQSRIGPEAEPTVLHPELPLPATRIVRKDFCCL